MVPSPVGSETSGPPAGPKRLGVLGTLVWDVIHQRDGRAVALQEWGGLAYALSAVSAALPEGWVAVPLIKVGRDRAEAALRFLRDLPGLELETGVRVVPETNNRVELRYVDRERRTEHLTGGVPAWSWPELAPLARSCDALYVNFISGFEMDLDAARALRASFPGPTYADLHSLFLGLGAAGLRIPRELPAWGAWLRCFDAVQMNEAEFDLLGRAWGDPWALAAHVVGPELKLIAVTLGERGAAWVTAPGFSADPSTWPPRRHGLGEAGAAGSGRCGLQNPPSEGDPTGCGDVWGATVFSQLLAGDSLDDAFLRANLAASRNVMHRGAAGLRNHLLGRLSGAS